MFSDLSEYKILFIENSISGAELFDIEEEDLIGLGVINLQHRKKILEAIKQLKDGDNNSISSYSDDLSNSSSQKSLNSSSSASIGSTSSQGFPLPLPLAFFLYQCSNLLFILLRLFILSIFYYL